MTMIAEMINEAMLRGFPEDHPQLAATLRTIAADPDRARADAMVGGMLAALRRRHPAHPLTYGMAAYWRQLRKENAE